MSKNPIMVHFELKGKDFEKFTKELGAFAKKSKAKATIFGQDIPGPWNAVGKEIQILMHLSDYKDLKIPGYAPLDYTQEGLSEKLVLDRSVVSRHLSSLKDKRLVKVKTLSIIGEGRKRKTYFLTVHGEELLAEAKKKRKK